MRFGSASLAATSLEGASYKTSPLFDETDKVVLDYAVGISSTPAEVSEELFSQLAEHFEAAQLVELTHVIAMKKIRGKFGIGLDVGAGGFSEEWSAPYQSDPHRLLEHRNGRRSLETPTIGLSPPAAV